MICVGLETFEEPAPVSDADSLEDGSLGLKVTPPWTNHKSRKTRGLGECLVGRETQRPVLRGWCQQVSTGGGTGTAEGCPCGSWPCLWRVARAPRAIVSQRGSSRGRQWTQCLCRHRGGPPGQGEATSPAPGPERPECNVVHISGSAEEQEMV